MTRVLEVDDEDVLTAEEAAAILEFAAMIDRGDFVEAWHAQQQPILARARTKAISAFTKALKHPARIHTLQ